MGSTRLLARWRRHDAGWVDDAPATGALAAASVENAVVFGRRNGQPVTRVGEPTDVGDAARVGT